MGIYRRENRNNGAKSNTRNEFIHKMIEIFIDETGDELDKYNNKPILEDIRYETT